MASHADTSNGELNGESPQPGSVQHQTGYTCNPIVGLDTNEARAASDAPAKLGTTGALDISLQIMEEGFLDTGGAPAVCTSAEGEGNIAVGSVPIGGAMADLRREQLPFAIGSWVLGYDLGSIQFPDLKTETNQNHLAITSAMRSLEQAWRRRGSVLRLLLCMVPIVCCVSGFAFWGMAFATLAMSDYPPGWMVAVGVLAFVFITTMISARTGAGRQRAVAIGMSAVQSECRRLNALPGPFHWMLRTDIVSISYKGRKGRKCVREETQYTLCVALQGSSLENEVPGEPMFS